MCGIVGGVGPIDKTALAKLAHRGPDAADVWQGDGFWLGHTRLSIIDVGARSNQPFKYGDTMLVFNGELWNYKELREGLRAIGATFRTEGDTEVVAAAIENWGLEALSSFEGMFAIAVTRDGGKSVKLIRDRHGEVPLHYSRRAMFFASELKAFPKGAVGEWVEPGTVVDVRTGVSRHWYELGNRKATGPLVPELIRAGIELGSREREISDVGYCLLLSGGIDSSAIAHHVGKRGTVAYTAVGNGKAIEERAAREVAEQIGLDLRLVHVPDPTADDLARVVHAIEMPHKAQVEIAWACHHLGLAMKRDGFRVTFSGEGSDELWASYGMAYHGIQKDGWHGFRRKLFHDQHRKNFARCNKIFMANGVECRLPFLSTRLVETALSLDEKDVREKGRPKAVLQRAYEGLLPRSVVDRQKMTFQDGVGLQAACARAVHDPQRFYRTEFETQYPGAKP